MPTIANRLTVSDVYYEAFTRKYVCMVMLDGELFMVAEVSHSEMVEAHPRFSQVIQPIALCMLEDVVLRKVLSQWEVPCVRTLTLEQKSRKTIISSCGQLTVSESHYLTVT